MTVTGDAGPQPVTGDAVAAMRAFNRLYTNVIGVLRGGYLGSPYSLTEARLIFELGQREVTEVAQLRRSLDIDAGYLSRILARFEADQLITRERSGADARRQVIALTEAGRTIQAGLDAQAARQIGALLAGLSGPAQRRLLAGIQEVTGVLAGTDQPRSYVLRPPRPGELGWVVQAQTAGYTQQYGWDGTYEAMVARIVADYGEHRDLKREAAWIAEVGHFRGLPGGVGLELRLGQGAADQADSQAAGASGTRDRAQVLSAKRGTREGRERGGARRQCQRARRQQRRSDPRAQAVEVVGPGT